MQCAHIVSRTYSHTRTDEDNAICLCGKCHFYFSKWPIEFAEFVFEKIGKAAYLKLKEKAESGVGVKMDWSAELVRLQNVHSGRVSG